MTISYRNSFAKGTRVIYGAPESVTGPSLFLGADDIAGIALEKSGVPGIETKPIFHKLISASSQLLEQRRIDEGWEVKRNIDFLALAKLLVARRDESDIGAIAQAITRLGNDCAERFPDMAGEIKTKTQIALCYIQQQKSDIAFHAKLKHEEEEEEEEIIERHHHEEEEKENEKNLAMIFGALLLILPVNEIEEMLEEAMETPPLESPMTYAAIIIGNTLVKGSSLVERMFGMDIPPEIRGGYAKLDIADGLDNLGRLLSEYRPDVKPSLVQDINHFAALYGKDAGNTLDSMEVEAVTKKGPSPFDMEMTPSFFKAG